MFIVCCILVYIMCVIASRPTSDFVAGNIANHYAKWEEIDTNQTVLNWLQKGVVLPLHTEPQDFDLPNKGFDAHESAWIDKEIDNLVNTGALKECPTKPRFISPISVVPKKSGSFRLIVDLRHLNEHITAPHFVHEDINCVLDQIKPKDHIVTVDIKQCFYHVRVADECQKYLCIQWKGKYYQWTVLPFGLNCSPYFVNKVLRPVVGYLRSLGIRLVLYVDDIILMSEPGTIIAHRDCLLQLMSRLGWFINYEKSSLVPSTVKEFIGYVLETDNEDSCVWIKIPNERISKLCKDINRALNKGQITARALARIAGQCISMAKAVLPAKLLLRNIYRLLRTRSTWQDILVLDEPTVSDLHWWKASLKSWNGRAVQPKQIDFQLTTDASSMGWGAKLGSCQAQGLWNTRLAYKHSNYREMMAILLGLHSFLPQIKGHSVQVLTDNISAAAYLNFQGGPSSDLTCVATAIWELALTHQIQLSAKYLAGRLNVEADWLSRLTSNHEWRLNPAVFKYLDRLWGPHTVDRCASMATTQLVRYNSMFLDPGTEAVDCLAQSDWHRENNFVNPPFRLIGRLLEVIDRQGAMATIIAPKWPAQRWFRVLQDMCICQPVRVPNNQGACLQIGNKIPEPLKNPVWRLYAWRICGRGSSRGMDGHLEP